MNDNAEIISVHRTGDGFLQPWEHAPQNVCPGCGQLNTGHQDRCPACLELERAPQGTQDALFTPAPAVIAGQTGMEI